MKVRHEIAIRDPTTIRIDKITKELIERQKTADDTFDVVLRRKFKVF